MTTRPNILLVIADGMQAGVLRAGHPCQTPNLDKLIARGVSLSQAYTPLPTCSPARASLMTGVLPHNHGVLQVEHVVDADQCQLRETLPHFASVLKDSGYHTAYFGKWHIERSEDLQKFGWQAGQALGKNEHQKFSKGQYEQDPSLDPNLTGHLTGPQGYRPILHWAVSDLPPTDRSVGQPAKKAIPYLTSLAQRDQPWCTCVSYYDPNEAMVAGRKAFELYPPKSLELPVNFRDDMRDRPNLYAREQRIFEHLSDQHWRHALACYYARITELDEQVGLLMQALEDSNQLDDTIILFTADHGKYVGSHGFEAHNVGGFEEIYNIPMIAAGPGIAAHGQVNARAGLHDLAPTILQLAHAPPAIDGPDSRSFAPLLRDPDRQASSYTQGYAEYHGTRFLLTQRIVWDGDWKLIFNPFDEDELYNLADDPFEMINLAGRQDHQSRVQQLMRQLWQKVRETGDKTIADTHYYSMRLAAVGPDAASTS